MRRADRAARRGTSLQGSDRTAGDSSPVTQINGRLRGRPGPAGGTKNTQGRIKGLRTPGSSSTMRTQLPAPDSRADGSAAVRHPTARGRDPVRPPCAGEHDDASRRAEGTRQRQAAQSPGAAPPGTGAALTSVPTREGPRGPRPRGPSHTRSRTRTPGDVTQDTSESCRPGRNLSQSPRVTSADGGGPVPGGGCRSSLFSLSRPVHRRRSCFFGGTGGIPRNGSRSAPKASAGTAGCRGSTARSRS